MIFQEVSRNLEGFLKDSEQRNHVALEFFYLVLLFIYLYFSNFVSGADCSRIISKELQLEFQPEFYS